MLWIFDEDRVRLRPGKRQRSGNLGNASEVVALVGIQWAQHLVRADRHGREEKHTVGFPLIGQQHHAIEQAICAFLR